MTSRHLVELGNHCRRLSAHASAFGEQLARAATEPFADRLPAGRAIVDVCEYQLFLGEELEALHARAVELDDRCAHRRSLSQELRGRRDGLVRGLHEELLGVVQTLTGSYCRGAMRRWLHPFSPLPQNPRELLLMVERFRRTLVDPELELPPLQPGVEVDLERVAAIFESPAQRLGETLAELDENEAALRLVQSRRSAALDRLRSLAGKTARFYEALADVAGEARIAGRLRRSRQVHG